MNLNSTAVIGESNSSKTQLILNTSHLSGPDLNEYMSLCEEIERLRVSQRHCLEYKNPNKATMTREEIFECSTLNDDEFLSALDHQNDSAATPAETKKNLSDSVENMLQYFDEDISISSRSNRSTPTNFATAGKVAAVVANFSKKCETTTTSTAQVNNPKTTTHLSGNIKELKAKYEAAVEPAQPTEVKRIEVGKIQTPPVLKAPRFVASVSLKSAADLAKSGSYNLKTASPKLLRKSKVKQIAQMFNTQISKLVHRNSTDIEHYAPLNNEYSPDPKLQPLPPKAPALASPVAKPRKKLLETRSTVANPKLPIYCTRSPKPSPRLRRRPSLKANGCKGLLPQDAFSQLSVRDKVLLYTKFIEAMKNHENPSLSKHVKILENNVHKQFARGEVVNEKQESVKHLTEELEAKCPFPKQTISPMALIRIKSTNDLTFIAKQNFDQVIRGENDEQSVQEGSGFFRAEYVQVDEGDDDDNNNGEAEPLHVSSLTVLLKPSPNGKLDDSLPAGRSKPLTRTKRNERLLDHLNMFEPTQKRSNDSIRSGSLATEQYAPPKKIRRTRSERLNPRQLFENDDMEELFFNWIKERNGVDFDIAHLDNEQNFVKLIQKEEEKSFVSSSDCTQKSAVERLLEEAIAKLENTAISENSTDTKIKIDENCNDATAAEEACQAPPAPLASQPTEVPKKPSRKQKAPAPPVRTEKSNDNISAPAAKQSKIDNKSGVSILPPLASSHKQNAPEPPMPTKQSSGSTSASSAKQSENECESDMCASIPPVPAPRCLPFGSNTVSGSLTSSAKQSDNDSESGVSTLPKPPENELQKSHEHNPAALSEHQLRIQASLQRLNIPDWFRQYNQTQTPETAGATGTGSTYKPGNFTRKRTQESGRWAGLNSKTTSLSSLGSQRSDRSPLLLSPSAHSHHGGQTTVAGHQQGNVTSAYSTAGTGSSGGAFSRWSTSHLNSSQTSPSVSQRGSFSRGGPINSSFMSVASSGNNSSIIRNSFRQPYLGWRSTEKLSQRTAHERLASSMLAQQQRTSPTQRTATAANGSIAGLNSKLQQPVTPEIQSSIKEVTSAIVHYVNDQTNQQRSRSTSPNSRKCWLESSFVGIRPLDSPQTPVIETAGTAFNVATANNLTNNSNNFSYNNPITTATVASTYLHNTTGTGTAGTTSSSTIGLTTNAANVLRMNGLSLSGGAPERSLSSASLEDVLASLLGLPPTSGAGAGLSTSDPYTRSTTGDTVSENPMVNFRYMPQQQLEVNNQLDSRLRRRSEGDAPNSQKQQKQQQQQQQQQKQQQQENAYKSNSAGGAAACINTTTADTSNVLQPRRVSLGDSSESCNNKTNTSSELQIRCRNTKCEHSAAPADAKKYYKSCHNCTHLYCSRECRRAHWEKHRKACLHSRASNLCRQVLSTCKDDVDTQRHLSLLARKGFLSQGRGVVRVLFRSAEAAEGFIKHGFQCMGEASYVRWPDLMPAEMGLELYAELLKLSTEYKPDSKMLIYVAICVVSEAPGMGQAPVRWERQLVSRCAKLKLCKTILVELEQQQQALQQQPLAVVAVPEPTTEILILTFNPNLRSSMTHRELILTNILDILSRRGVLLRKHYPEIYQRLQSYTEGQTDKFNPVTLHPRDSQTGQSFVCIIMPVHLESEIIKLPSAADGGNRVTTIDVGSPAALAQLDDDELLTRSTS